MQRCGGGRHATQRTPLLPRRRLTGTAAAVEECVAARLIWRAGSVHRLPQCVGDARRLLKRQPGGHRGLVVSL